MKFSRKDLPFLNAPKTHQFTLHIISTLLISQCNAHFYAMHAQLCTANAHTPATDTMQMGLSLYPSLLRISERAASSRKNLWVSPKIQGITSCETWVPLLLTFIVDFDYLDWSGTVISRHPGYNLVHSETKVPRLQPRQAEHQYREVVKLTASSVPPVIGIANCVTRILKQQLGTFFNREVCTKIQGN